MKEIGWRVGSHVYPDQMDGWKYKAKTQKPIFQTDSLERAIKKAEELNEKEEWFSRAWVPHLRVVNYLVYDRLKGLYVRNLPAIPEHKKERI